MGGTGKFETAWSVSLGQEAETACWGDVDGDGDLDLFLPTYSNFTAMDGNHLFENGGPSLGFKFKDVSICAGVVQQTLDSCRRPEGAQFVDADCDGDIDLYSNGHLYQNVSYEGANTCPKTNIRFNILGKATTGIERSNELDEGALFFDYDLDGDFDLIVLYSDQDSIPNQPGCTMDPRPVLWESEGDGSFVLANAAIPGLPRHEGALVGVSAEDWDNDGDMDLTTQRFFHRNNAVENLTADPLLPPFEIALPGPMYPEGEGTVLAEPAWADWDHDGDLDCALANHFSDARFYVNNTYSATTPVNERLYVRVRIVRDDGPDDLETEYGAIGQIRVAGDPPSLRRRKFVASSGGYLNQNEYTLHFGLPPGPDPLSPALGVVFDVSVDFPGRSDLGIRRVDKIANPVLGDIELSALVNREIIVRRDGSVSLDGSFYETTTTDQELLMATTAGGLVLPAADAPVVSPLNQYVGVEVLVLADVLVKEIVLDGRLEPGAKNVALWDISDTQEPVLVVAAKLATSPRNDRSYFQTSIPLQSGHRYRAIARVKEHRSTSIPGSSVLQNVKLVGGLRFFDTHSASGVDPVVPPVVADSVFLALRYVQRN